MGKETFDKGIKTQFFLKDSGGSKEVLGWHDYLARSCWTLPVEEDLKNYLHGVKYELACLNTQKYSGTR